MTPLPSWKANGSPAGWLLDGQEALNTLPVRQFAPTYCATTVSLSVSVGPEPWIRVVTESLDGGALFGIVTTGCWPAVAVTVGSLPPPSLDCEPLADADGLNCSIRSMTQTSVSLPVTPRLVLPLVP